MRYQTNKYKEGKGRVLWFCLNDALHECLQNGKKKEGTCSDRDHQEALSHVSPRKQEKKGNCDEPPLTGVSRFVFFFLKIILHSKKKERKRG